MSFNALNWAKNQKTGSPAGKVILLLLAETANNENVSWPKKKRLAEEAEVSIETVRRHLRKLEDMGLISGTNRYRRTDGGQTSTQYVLHVAPPAQNEEGGAQVVEGGGTHPRGGGVHTGEAPPSSPVRTPEEPPVEPPEEPTETCVRMWGLWKTLTGKRHELTPKRRHRLEKVAAAIREQLATDPPGVPQGEDVDRVVAVFAVMVRALWSDPWRRESSNRFDPVSVYRSAEQIETWLLDALDELAAGRDGSDFAKQRSGQAEKQAARDEEAQERAKRARARDLEARRREEVEKAETDRVQEENARLRTWYERQDDTTKARIRSKVKTQLAGRTGEMLERMVWISVLTKESAKPDDERGAA